MRTTSSGLASGPAMIEAGSPGARWMSTKATVATTRTTGMSASRRRATYVFTRSGSPCGSLRQPDVLVEDGLDLLPHRPALPRIGLAGERVHPLLLGLVAPPARPVAAHGRAEGGLGIERDARREDVPDLGLVPTLHQGGPIHHLEVDLEAGRLQLLLGHQRVLVHPLIFLGCDPAYGLPGIAGGLEQLLRPGGVLLVVEIAGRPRVPLRLLGERETGIEP